MTCGQIEINHPLPVNWNILVKTRNNHLLEWNHSLIINNSKQDFVNLNVIKNNVPKQVSDIIEIENIDEIRLRTLEKMTDTFKCNIINQIKSIKSQEINYEEEEGEKICQEDNLNLNSYTDKIKKKLNLKEWKHHILKDLPSLTLIMLNQ